ncbi:mCG1039731 [Mus musculus]|nr:mCG1039731 [Mus musculus]
MRGTRSLLEAEASSGSQWKMGCHGSAPPSPLTLAVLLEGLFKVLCCPLSL